jgi:hypothetical protein
MHTLKQCNHVAPDFAAAAANVFVQVITASGSRLRCACLVLRQTKLRIYTHITGDKVVASASIAAETLNAILQANCSHVSMHAAS